MNNTDDKPPLWLYSVLKTAQIIVFITLLGVGFIGFGQGTLVEGFPTTIIEEAKEPLSQNTPESTLSQPYLIAPFSAGPYVKTIEITVTGYSSTPDQTDDTPFITASGKIVRPGIVAANFLPFGTKVRFPQLFPDQIFIVEDRMHKRFQDKRVDIWFPDRTTAEEFGIKKTIMEIIY